MSRPSRVRAMALGALLVAAGCQDYNFNPVGHCLISPNTKRVQLSKVSTADVLFVVDDSGSMGGEQAKLSAAFTDFIANLDQYNQKRVTAGQLPIDFHLAVTTTSVFYNDQTGAQCRTDCPGASSGDAICCNMSGTSPVSPYASVQTCTGTGSACAAGECRQDCQHNAGDWVCCDPNTKVPATRSEVSCSHPGDACGTLSTHYFWDAAKPACTPGHAALWGKYPQGDFVADPAAPRVIHFDKQLYKCDTPPCTTNQQGFTATALKTMFTQNVVAGTCGSNQEQPLEAARKAVEKAIAHQQRDIFSTTDGTKRTDTQADWLHDNAKLVLVFVGDEDDCSSPADPSGVVMNGSDPGTPTEACVADATLPADKQKEYSVTSRFVDYFTTLPGDRPLGAAFIVSARSAGSANYCQDESCVADICCDTACTKDANVCTTRTCGGQAKGSRLLEAASELRTRTAGNVSVDVVSGSICDPNFGDILTRIADIVKPPNGLLLPSQPADAGVSVLRIAGADGKTRKTCFGPAPATMTAADAKLAGYDWWYTASREQVTDDQKHPTGASRFVLINDTDNCRANPGETYSADYIARLPTAGCSGADAAAADHSCVSALGGRDGDWTCFAGVDSAGACIVPTGGSAGVVGTCLCGARGGPPAADAPAGTAGTGNCPNG